MTPKVPNRHEIGRGRLLLAEARKPEGYRLGASVGTTLSVVPVNITVIISYFGLAF